MPYISPGLRLQLDPADELSRWPDNPGELNYVITEYLLRYLDKHEERYQTINDIIGVLECAKQEFYRRIAAPYEEMKIRSNGDVYSQG